MSPVLTELALCTKVIYLFLWQRLAAFEHEIPFPFSYKPDIAGTKQRI